MGRLLLGAWLSACAACGGDALRGSDGDAPSEVDAADADAGDADAADAGDADAADMIDTRDAPDVTDTTDMIDARDASDTAVDTAAADASDTDASDAADTTDTSDTADAATCVEGDPCTFIGYLPPCYQARCNASGACTAVKVEDCCLGDADCALGDPGACGVVRCLQNTCMHLRDPGCCVPDEPADCDDAVDATADQCVAPASRCEHCLPDCGARPPLFAADFDAATATPGALGFQIVESDYADAITWQRTTDHFAAGGGAVYFGDARCHTYYGGSLDAACQPVDARGEDSVRVSGGLYTPYVSLPQASPAVLTAWVRAAVEPLEHLGAAEPDVLRVSVEPFGALATLWPVASTLDLGKSTEWAPLAVDLSPWAGQLVRVRFDFDTLDGQDNRYEGVWLDEIVIREACSEGGCCDDDTDCGGGAACSVGACLQTSEGGARVCARIASHPGELCTPCASDEACADDDPCTADTCAASGECAHDTFCCLERDLFATSFDGTLGGMAVSDDDASDLVTWQPRDGAAWFGDAAHDDYDADARTSGDLVSPEVDLPASLAPRAHARLAFDLRLSTEWDLDGADPLAALDNPAGLDRLSVAVVDGAFTTELWSSDRIGGTTRGATLPIALDLGPWLGRAIRVVIRFDSGDETLNAFGGAFIDDLAIGIRCD